MEFDREQIIKAFECCHTLSSDCLSCPFLEDGKACASISLSALALIKELTEENEKLNEEIRIRDEIIDYRGSEVLRHDRCIRALHKEIETLKVDTVRKMQEKIMAKSEYGTINISHWQLDQIAKEVLEENK